VQRGVVPSTVPCTCETGPCSVTLAAAHSTLAEANTPLLQCTQALQEPESPFMRLQLASTSLAAHAQLPAHRTPPLLQRQLR
jgi:hypothetical protein